MSERHWPRSPSGFTIVEMMVALVLLTVTITTFLSVTQTTDRLSTHHAYLTQALTVGEQVTEELLMLGATSDDLASGAHSRYFSRKGLEVDEGTHVYEVQWSVSSYPDVPSVIQLEVKTIWEIKGEEESVSWVTWRK